MPAEDRIRPHTALGCPVYAHAMSQLSGNVVKRELENYSLVRDIGRMGWQCARTEVH